MLLMKGHATVWLRGQEYDYEQIVYSDIKTEIVLYFNPAEHERRARDALTRCIHQHPVYVFGYISEFLSASQCIAHLSEDVNLDLFLKGLHINILEKYSWKIWILLQMPAILPRKPLLFCHISMSANANNYKDIIADHNI